MMVILMLLIDEPIKRYYENVDIAENLNAMDDYILIQTTY